MIRFSITKEGQLDIVCSISPKKIITRKKSDKLKMKNVLLGQKGEREQYSLKMSKKGYGNVPDQKRRKKHDR